MNPSATQVTYPYPNVPTWSRSEKTRDPLPLCSFAQFRVKNRSGLSCLRGNGQQLHKVASTERLESYVRNVHSIEHQLLRVCMIQTSDRYLHFDNIDMEQPNISSRCSQCGQTFNAEPKEGERVDGILLRIRAEFNAHQCLMP